jgi:hypothetical protein
MDHISPTRQDALKTSHLPTDKALVCLYAVSRRNRSPLQVFPTEQALSGSIIRTSLHRFLATIVAAFLKSKIRNWTVILPNIFLRMRPCPDLPLACGRVLIPPVQPLVGQSLAESTHHIRESI